MSGELLAGLIFTALISGGVWFLLWSRGPKRVRGLGPMPKDDDEPPLPRLRDRDRG